MDPEHEPVRRPDRSGAGFFWGAALLVLLAAPILATLFLMIIAFGGCWIGCQTRRPFAGFLLLAAEALMLALPFVVGSAISQRSRRTWFAAMWIAIAAVLLLAVGVPAVA